MPIVVGIVFKRAGKVYYFDPDTIDLIQGEKVIVKTSRGMEFGEVVATPMDVPEEEITAPLKKVIRKATDEDRDQLKKNKQKEKEAFSIADEKIAKHKLPMKLIEVEFVFDASKIIFYFTSDGRVDFRELVKDMASVLKTRIELRQIGVRDEAKMVGGLGPCGQRLCCTVFLGDFEPVSIRMAKEQDLPLNPLKISGVCGRLMCCLKYEYEAYVDFKKRAPRRGTRVTTDNGIARIVDYNVPKEIIIAELESGKRIEMALKDALQCTCKAKCREDQCGNGNNAQAELEDESDAELLKELEETEQKETGNDKSKGRNACGPRRNYVLAEDVIDENEGFIDNADRSSGSGRPDKNENPDNVSNSHDGNGGQDIAAEIIETGELKGNESADRDSETNEVGEADGVGQQKNLVDNKDNNGKNDEHHKKDKFGKHGKHGKPFKSDKNKHHGNGKKG